MTDADFIFNGFPEENKQIEVPDEEEPNSKRKPDPFKDMPPGLKDALKQLSDFDPGNMNEGAQYMRSGNLPQEIQNILNMFLGLNGMIEAAYGDDDDENCDDENEDLEDSKDKDSQGKSSKKVSAKKSYTLNEPDWLSGHEFGTIECIEDPEIYEKFIKKYGYDSKTYADRIKGVQDFILDKYTSQLPIGEINNMKYIKHDNKSILFYATTSIPDTFGFFVSVIETSDNEFAIYIPILMNSFNIDENDNVTLINPVEQQELFNIGDDGVASFKGSIDALGLATNFMLAPKKRTLLNPHQFGTIRNIRASVTSSDRVLKIGIITSNESPEAVLFKKDAELDLDQTEFPLYINFQNEISKPALKKISEILFETDFNECPLFDNLELHHTLNGSLYVNIDLGEF